MMTTAATSYDIAGSGDMAESTFPRRRLVPRELPDAARSSKTIATARSLSSAGCCFRTSPVTRDGH